MKQPMCIVSLTDAGQLLAQQLRDQLAGDVQLLHKPKPFTATVQGLFEKGQPLVFITAMGIAVRSLAGVIKNKKEDPPVLVIDEQGAFVIPMLSGHEGGANELAKTVANIFQAQVVITTAKAYLSPVYTVGMGCEKGCTAQHLETLLGECLQQAGVCLGDIKTISSIDIKAAEQGLIELAGSIKKPYVTYSAKTLSVVENLLSTKSDYVHSIVGVYGVAESAALFAAQQATGDVAELVLTKQKTGKATCAIARSYPLNTE